MAGTTYCVLVADDEPTNRTLLQLGFRAKKKVAGFQVDTADSGASATVKLETDPYDLVILDVDMPPYRSLPSDFVEHNEKDAPRLHDGKTDLSAAYLHLLDLCQRAREKNPAVMLSLYSGRDEAELKALSDSLGTTYFQKGRKPFEIIDSFVKTIETGTPK